jgi:hypothetical protein
VNLRVATAAHRHLCTQCTQRTHMGAFFVLLRRDHAGWRGGVDDGADRWEGRQERHVDGFLRDSA